MKLKIFHLALFSLIILTGCSIKEGVKNASDEEILKERGAAYWGHMCKQEFDKAYEFEYPVYRKTVGLVNYVRRFRPNVKWSKAVIENVEIKDDTATMKVKVETEVKMMASKAAKKAEFKPLVELNEKWIKVDGVWYHVPENVRKSDKEV